MIETLSAKIVDNQNVNFIFDDSSNLKGLERIDVSNYNQIIMSRIKGVPSYEKLGAFYEKQGFHHLEDDYIKCL